MSPCNFFRTAFARASEIFQRIRLEYFLVTLASCHSYSGTPPDFTAEVAALHQIQDQLTTARQEAQVEQIPRLEDELHQRSAQLRKAMEAAAVPADGKKADLEAYAFVCEAGGDYDLAAETWEKICALEPADPFSWLRLGVNRARRSGEHPETAIAALQKALALAENSNHPDLLYEAHEALGNVYLERKLLDEAEEHFKKALENSAEALPPQIGIMVVNVYRGKILDAYKTFSSLGKKLQPYDALLRIQIRDALYELERLRKPLPSSAEVHAALARFYYQAGRVLDAVLAGQHAVRQNPQDVETLNFIGDIQFGLGNIEAAKTAYKHSLEIRGEQPDIQKRLEQLETLQK